MKYILETPVCTWEIVRCGKYWELYSNDECYGRAEKPEGLAGNVASWATGNPDWDMLFLPVSESLGDWIYTA
ncbi:MAG: hypothetical protein IJ234_01275 [Clostridia bacterium]|nr:hypothetical protein [Clostridia bacterium]